MTETSVAVSIRLSSIVKHFELLPDPGHKRNRRHLLVHVITIAVCGVIVGCSGPTAIARWARAKQQWLQEVLALPNGIPSRDCIRRVLSTLKPQAFQTGFQSWIASLVSEDENIRPTMAIDGKTLRRSHDQSDGLGPLHLVSAWASEQGLALGQVATEGKSNEITAIPALIDRIDVKGAIVTIDAMGCQKDIAEKIVDAKGDYVLAVKDNQADNLSITGFVGSGGWDFAGTGRAQNGPVHPIGTFGSIDPAHVDDPPKADRLLVVRNLSVEPSGRSCAQAARIFRRKGLRRATFLVARNPRLEPSGGLCARFARVFRRKVLNRVPAGVSPASSTTGERSAPAWSDPTTLTHIFSSPPATTPSTAPAMTWPTSPSAGSLAAEWLFT